MLMTLMSVNKRLRDVGVTMVTLSSRDAGYYGSPVGNTKITTSFLAVEFEMGRHRLGGSILVYGTITA